MNLRLLAHHPVLNFVNTVDPREGPERVEYLRQFSDLIDWAKRASILSERDGRKIASAVKNDSPLARRALKQAIELREALYSLFSQIACDQTPQPRVIAELLDVYRHALAQADLVQNGSHFYWRLPLTPDFVRWRIALDAVEFLESAELNRVKRCPGIGDCGWLFLDTSKNATRRWCSMEGCGNRAKYRRFRRRKKQS